MNGEKEPSISSWLIDLLEMMVKITIAKTSVTTVEEVTKESLTTLTTFKAWVSMQFGFLQSFKTEMEDTMDTGGRIFTS